MSEYQRYGCNCAEPCDEYHGWRCAVTDGPCVYLYPNAVACARDWGEGPLAVVHEEGADGNEL